MMGLGGTVEPEGSGWDYPSVSSFEDEERRRREAREALDAQLGGAGLADVAELERRSARRRAIEAATGSPAALSSLATAPQEDVRYLQALERAKTAAGLPSKPAAMVDGLAMGATPPTPSTPTPTPEGEALFADLQAAGRARNETVPVAAEPALPEGHWMRRAGAAIGRGAASLGRSLVGFADDPDRKEWWDAPGSMSPAPPAAPPPTGSLSPPAPSMRPVPNLPPLPAPKRRGGTPRMELEAPPNFTMQVPPTPFADEGPLPADHPAVAKALEAAQPRQGMPDLDSALQAGADRRLLAGLVRAGGTAIGRGRGPGYDALDAEADRPLAELALRRGEVQRVKSEEQAASDADPNSSQSAMARALVARTLPGVEREPWFAGASYARLASGPLAKLLDMNADIQKARIDAQARVDAVRAKRGSAGGKGGLKQADLERFSQKAAKDLAGFADMSGDLGTVLGAAESADVAGIGPGAGLLPDVLTSGEGTENRRAARRLVENLLKAQSGLAASDREQVRKLASTSLSERASDADWRAGARELAVFVQRAMRSREAAYPPAVIDMLEERGGTTSRDIPTGAPAGRGGAPAASTGVRKQYSPSRNQTRLIYPDGRVEVRDGRL